MCEFDDEATVSSYDLGLIIKEMKRAVKNNDEFTVTTEVDEDDSMLITFTINEPDKPTEETIAKIKSDFPDIGELEIGYSWPCPDDGFDKKNPNTFLDVNKPNPHPYCVYDIEEDPICDFCLYCGQPEERK